MNSNIDDGNEVYEIMNSFQYHDEIYINGPYGDWKYLDSPGKFYYIPYKEFYKFRSILMICEGEGYRSMMSVVNNEILPENVEESSDLRILYLIDEYQELLDGQVLDFIVDNKLGRVKIVTQDQSILDCIEVEK